MIRDNKNYFQPGGSLPADAPTYIRRKADEKLYNLLVEGKFSYVLTARQMGKSSLRVRIAEQLSNQGVSSVSIDLTNIGSVDTTADQWYYSLLSGMCRSLNIAIKQLRQWWHEHQDLSPVNRFSSFIDEVLLEETSEPIIVFIDEIDYILSLDKTTFSTDDFFAVIRHCYNSRADKAKYERLTFCLLGVATPNDLMQDPSRTPFNIGYQVELDMLTAESASPLLNGLQNLSVSAKEILPEIINWTGGHPYLTQKVCHFIASNPERVRSKNDIEPIINELFLSEEAEDHNLKNVNNRILLHKKYNIQMLELLQKLFKEEPIESNDKDYTQLYLKLSGLVKTSDNKLVIANKIYQKAFDKNWLNSALTKIKRPFSEDLQRWIDLEKAPSAALRGEVLAHALQWAGSRDDLTSNEKDYITFSQIVQKEEEAKELELEYAGRLKTRNRFLVAALSIVLLAGGLAVYYAIEAGKQKKIAQINELNAKRQKDIAEQNKLKADNQRKKAEESEKKAKANLQILKKSLTNLGENELCYLGIVELFNADKILYSTMLATSADRSIEKKFVGLEQSVKQRLNMKKEDFQKKLKTIPLPSKVESNKAKGKLVLDKQKKNKKSIKEILKEINIGADVKVLIPEETKQKYPRLVAMVLLSKSMNNKERNYWLQVLPVMTKPQVAELLDILETEIRKLKEIEEKYGSKPNSSSYEFLSNTLRPIARITDKKIKPIHIRSLFSFIIAADLSKYSDKQIKNITFIISKLENIIQYKHEYNYILSYWYFKQKKYSGAISILTSALKEKPNSIRYMEQMATYYEKSNKNELAITTYNKILSVLSSYQLIVDSKQNEFYSALTHIKKGNVYYKEKKSDLSKQEYEKAYDKFKYLLSFNTDKTKKYYSEVRKLCAWCKYDDVRDWKTVLKQHEILMLIADKLISNDRSIDNLNRAYGAYWSAGFYAGELNDNGIFDQLDVKYTKRALALSEEVLNIKRDEEHLDNYHALLTNLVEGLIKVKSYKEALDIANKSIIIGEEIKKKFSNSDRLSNSYSALSDVSFAKKDFKKSIQLLKKALKISDKYKSEIETSLAENYIFTGNFKKARKLLLKYRGKTKKIKNRGNTGRIWNQIILENFQDFRKDDFFHQDMAKIEELMDVLVQDAQFLLDKLAYKPGEANNKLNEKTISAIRAFQKDQGLKVDGKVSPKLINIMVDKVYKKQKQTTKVN